MSASLGGDVVQLHNVSKRFGKFEAVKSVSWSLGRGGVYGLIGENGAGKSTLIRMICGLTRPTAGRISLFGKTNQEDIRHVRSCIGYVPDASASYPDLSARDNLTVRCIEWGIPQEGVIDSILRLVGLEGVGRKRARSFSMGMRRRLDLGIAFLGDPKLLILDEPTNDFDIATLNVLEEYLRSFKGCVIVVSHDREFLDGLVSRVYEFRSGHVTEHIGGIYDWLEKRDREDGTSVSNPRAAAPVQRETKAPESATGAQDYQRQKEAAKERRALERELKAQEERSEAIDAELSALEEKLADPAHATDAKLFEQYSQLKKEQEQVLARWEELSMQLEEG